MSEVNARKIVQIFKMFQVEPDHMLMVGSIMAKASEVGLPYEDIEASIREAISLGWIREGGSQRLFLTQAGARLF